MLRVRAVEHRPHQHAHHVAQEGVGGDVELEPVAVAAPLRGEHGAVEVDVLGLGRRERREVVGADEGRGACVEGGRIEGAGVVELVAPPQRIAARAGVQAVDVASGAGVPAGVERAGGFARLGDCDVGREAVVQRDGREQA